MTQQLRASREEVDRARLRLETTLASLSDGVIITDEDGALLRMNGPAVQLLGLPAAPPSGLPFVQVSRDHELAALLRDALAAPDGSPRFAVVDYGRSRRVLEATAQRLAGAEERLGLVVLRDVTELRRLERVRREFVANVSHELRTPLASIKALVETLEAGAMEDPAVAGDFLHRIVGEVDRLATLVDELLDLARLDSGRVVLHPEPLDPGELLSRAAERLRPQTERARLALELRVPPDLPPVRADRARVEQVMLNLLHNAIKFTPPEGTITVTASVDGQMLEVAVRDTGVGVAEDELPRLFERFYKADKARRSDGTGLGLAIAKHIVQAHGGTIWAESRPGEGATVRFTLPLAADGDAHPPAGVANGDRTAGRARPEARRRAD
jgi:two-component system phosphate regulon sensor histidine kinase PhoR